MRSDNYKKFLLQKKKISSSMGISDFGHLLNKYMFPFQKEIVSKALIKGKYAIFADCGLGKTLMQLSWAEIVSKKTNKSVLILAPLAVSRQTKREGDKFGIDVKIIRSQLEIGQPGVYISNYEIVHKFDPSELSGIVLDESSILKSFDGKTKEYIISEFSEVPYKLACTATPSPNDFMELGNHAEFLDILSRVEMLATYFINDASDTGTWRIKGHAEDEFWQFVGSWAVMIQKPSDIGFSDEGYDIPPLIIKEHIIPSEIQDGLLCSMPVTTLSERRGARKSSLLDRVNLAREIVKEDKSYLIWCDLNDESAKLKEIFSDRNNVAEVKGADTSEYKESSLIGFSNGDVQILISKPSIAGFGMNWQNCNEIIFCGLSDSYEKFYQAIRRCWRFGQTKPVTVHVIISEREIVVLNNIKEKQKNHSRMFIQMTRNISSRFYDKKLINIYMEHEIIQKKFRIILGDCVEKILQIDDNSIDFSIFSPPFASLYTYSASERDMGNCKNKSEFFDHFSYLIKELYRVLKPGRLVSFHCMNLPTSKMRDGYIGLTDFRGDLIRMFMNEGFIYHSEVCIWKDPVVAMQRTKALGLLHKQIKKDSSMCRQGIADYLVTMRKPGINNNPIIHNAEDFPVNEWQKIASPIWIDIRQGDTLQRQSAREDKDEKHICPLQLGVIERALWLWSNPNDLVLSPFMGIGSEGYVSLKLGRRFIGIELKKSYFDQAMKNLEIAVIESQKRTLFDILDDPL